VTFNELQHRTEEVILKMETAGFSEISVPNNQTKSHHIPEDCSLYNCTSKVLDKYFLYRLKYSA
jgi:hypothetical protein